MHFALRQRLNDKLDLLDNLLFALPIHNLGEFFHKFNRNYSINDKLIVM
jgi:hypothetical protein